MKKKTQKRSVTPRGKNRDARRYAVGVLFVHGIGEQPRGDTLVRFAEPIVKWIERWVRQSSRRSGKAVIRKAVVTAAPLSSDEPPHVTLEIQARSSASWLLTESWWASEFQRPTFGRLASWMATRGPWIILSHFAKHLVLAPHWWGKLLALIPLALSVFLVFLFQIVLGLLVVLALIPVPQLRSALSGFLLKLTGTLGDSYVLTESPIQRAAAVARVRKDLNWMVAQGCKTLVVIAHSQGTAIAHEALSASRPSSLRRFITLGSGLIKLEELRLLTDRIPAVFTIVGFAIPLLMLALLYAPFPPPGLSEDNIDFGRYIMIFIPAFLLLSPSIAATKICWGQYKDRVEKLALDLEGDDFKWIDYYSTADPVPNGSLTGFDALDKRTNSTRVYNLMSIVRDHSAYWDNQDEFISKVVRDIDDAAKTRLFSKTARSYLAQAANARPRRVRTLFLVRLIAFLSVIVGCIGLFCTLINDQTIKHVKEMLESIPQPWHQLTMGMGELVDRDSLTGFAIVSFVVFVGMWHLLTKRLWKTWDNLAVKYLFRKRTEGERREQAGVGVLVVVMGLVPLVAASVTHMRFDMAQLVTLVWTVTWMSPELLFGVMMLAMLVTAILLAVYRSIMFFVRRIRAA